jgi:enoyl-[acyl-carrier-protein] reductase (NADH)
VKYLEKHLEIVSQINLKMGSLQFNIEDLDKWRSIEKNVPSILPLIKSYDIILHTLATTECQELASRFEEIVRQDLAGMMELYEKYIYDIQRYVQWYDIKFK